MLQLSHDIICIIVSYMNARSIYGLLSTNKSLWVNLDTLIQERVLRLRSIVLNKEYISKTSNGMNLIDLARLEAWLSVPIGDCVSCLTKINNFASYICSQCRESNSANFKYGSQNAYRCDDIKFTNSHVCMVYTCPICESSTCINCIRNDTSACAMCRVGFEQAMLKKRHFI